VPDGEHQTSNKRVTDGSVSNLQLYTESFWSVQCF
jgi:hypothetical protein